MVKPGRVNPGKSRGVGVQAARPPYEEERPGRPGGEERAPRSWREQILYEMLTSLAHRACDHPYAPQRSTEGDDARCAG